MDEALFECSSSSDVIEISSSVAYSRKWSSQHKSEFAGAQAWMTTTTIGYTCGVAKDDSLISSV
jgi:hypothetical protein